MVLETFLNLIYQGSYLSYLAVFLSTFFTSATIIVPIVPLPSYVPILIGVGSGLNPFLVGLLGGIGSSVGELLGYLAGLGGSSVIEKFEKRTPRFIKKFERFYSNIGFWVIAIFALVPFPFDIIGVLSGASKYDFRKFLLALLMGRLARSLLIAYGVSFAIPAILNLFS